MVIIQLSAKGTKQTKPPAEALLELSGSWKDSRDADEIIADLRGSRRNISEKNNTDTRAGCP
jgi:hypothetical protein